MPAIYATGGGNIIKTTDGKSWSMVSAPEQSKLDDLRLFSDERGFLISGTNRIFLTEDGSLSWSQKYHIASYAGPGCLSFGNENTGYIGVPVSGAAGTTVYKTADGGNNWSDLSPVFNDFNINRLLFLTPSTGWAVGSSAGNEAAYRTTDGGATWIQKLNPAKANTNLNSVYFTTASSGILVGDSGSLYRTSDGGDSWLEVPLPPTLTGLTNLYSIEFTNPQTGYIAGYNRTVFPVESAKGVILKTVDGGASWQEMFPNVTEKLKDMIFIDKKTGYCVGDNGTIIRTTNSGLLWTVLQSPVPDSFFSVSSVLRAYIPKG
jgi:photosystem II stability/assembly factor-like uncharacterized protein